MGVREMFGKAIELSRGRIGTAQSYVMQRAQSVNNVAREKVAQTGSATSARASAMNSNGANGTLSDMLLKRMQTNQANYTEATTVGATKAFRAEGKRLDNAMSSEGTSTFDRIKNIRRSGAMSDKELATGVVKEHFLGGDWKRNTGRIGGAIGTYAGGNLIGRSLTGGNAYENSSGKRDIAGIPFI